MDSAGTSDKKEQEKEKEKEKEQCPKRQKRYDECLAACIRMDQKEEVADAWWRGWNAATTIIDAKLEDQRDEWYQCGWDDAMRVKAVEEAVTKLAPHEFAKSSQGKTTDNGEA